MTEVQTHKGRRTSPSLEIPGALLARNTLLNLIGQGLPLIVAVVSMPFVIRGLGTERFGILALAWVVLGYFSLFDLGLGRAVTKLVAEKLGTAGHESEIPAIVWTALALMAVLGMAATVVVVGLSPWVVRGVLKISDALQSETLKVFYLLAFSIPIVISTAGLRGVLEAHQRFDLVNAVRVPLGIFTFLGPLAVLPFSKSLFPVVAVLVVGRLLAWGAHLLLCLRLVPALRHGISVQRTMIQPLLSFGSWITVSSIVGPLMLYIDRFLIAGLISITAVAYYATPYEIVTRLLIIPSAVMGVLFPAFSLSFVQNKTRVAYLYKQAMKSVFLILFPIVLVIALFAQEALALWLDDEFATNGFRVAQLLVIGVLINSLGLVSQSLVQASGRPDLTGKLHLIELPLYLTYLWGLLHAYGINGAAFAWLIRVTISALVLAILARRSISKITTT